MLVAFTRFFRIKPVQSETKDLRLYCKLRLKTVYWEMAGSRAFRCTCFSAPGFVRARRGLIPVATPAQQNTGRGLQQGAASIPARFAPLVFLWFNSVPGINQKI